MTTEELRDLHTVLDFVLENFPNYEDAIGWGDDLRGEEYDFYNSAQRLKLLLPDSPERTRQHDQ